MSRITTWDPWKWPKAGLGVRLTPRDELTIKRIIEAQHALTERGSSFEELSNENIQELLSMLGVTPEDATRVMDHIGPHLAAVLTHVDSTNKLNKNLAAGNLEPSEPANARFAAIARLIEDEKRKSEKGLDTTEPSS